MIQRGDKVVYYDGRVMLISDRGWRQWYDTDGDGEVDRFTIILFSEGINEKAIQGHVKGGWIEYQLDSTDGRWTYISHGDLNGDDVVELIYKSHNIPAGPP